MPYSTRSRPVRRTMRVSRCLPAMVLLAASPAPAEEPPGPDAAFLEYLGMWDGRDEEWELFEDVPFEDAPIQSVDDLGERRPESPPETPEEIDDEG